jgi:hypothetical protein
MRMNAVVNVEYRIPISAEQDARVQELAHHLALARGERRISIRQIVREALDAYCQQHRSAGRAG